MPAPQLEALQAATARILETEPEGLSEYALLTRLREDGHLPPRALGDNLALFRSHFLLFHVLYRLREAWWQDRRHDLRINPLSIVCKPWQPGQDALAHSDPLRSYYLDPANLDATGEAEVEQLLDDFWRRFTGADERAAALAVLELSEPVDAAAIKARYRELVMRHHPDRGGDTARLQEINEAMAWLEKGRGKSKAER